MNRALRILVVEDDGMIALALDDVLVGMGHEVCAVAATEAEAVLAAMRFSRDLMVVDVLLASGSGLGAVEQVRRRGPMRALFVSGDIKGVMMAMPSATAIQKPFTEFDLARGIKRALDAPVAS